MWNGRSGTDQLKTTSHVSVAGGDPAGGVPDVGGPGVAASTNQRGQFAAGRARFWACVRRLLSPEGLRASENNRQLLDGPDVVPCDSEIIHSKELLDCYGQCSPLSKITTNSKL